MTRCVQLTTIALSLFVGLGPLTACDSSKKDAAASKDADKKDSDKKDADKKDADKKDADKKPDDEKADDKKADDKKPDAEKAAPKVKVPEKAAAAKALIKKATPPPADQLATAQECQDAIAKVTLAVLAAGAAEEDFDLESASEDELAIMLAAVAMEIFGEDLDAAEADCQKNATKAELACLNKADEFEQVIGCMAEAE